MVTPWRLQVGNSEILDVRHLYPPEGPMARHRDAARLAGIAIHHDGVLFTPTGPDYSGSTLLQDLNRLNAIHEHSLAMGWGPFPYHFVASPGGRTFYTVDVDLFGAHVAGRNHELLGIALMGNFTYSHPGDPQLCAAGQAVTAVWYFRQRLLTFRGHREWALPDSPTSCPGDTWWTWQNRLLVLSAAAARIAFPR